MPRKKTPVTQKAEAERAAKLAAIRASGGVPRDAKGRVLPGHSLNQLGRPRTALSELCRAQVTKRGLIGVLGEIAARTGKHRREVSVADQIRAIQLLLMYGFGVPKGEIENGDVKIEVTYDNRSLTIANAAPGTGTDYSGVPEVQHSPLRQETRQDLVGHGPIDPTRSEA